MRSFLLCTAAWATLALAAAVPSQAADNHARRNHREANHRAAHLQHRENHLEHRIHRERHRIHHEHRVIHREHNIIHHENRVVRHAVHHALRHELRPEVRRLRAGVYAHRRFHWRPYHRPHGWYYRHWTYGQFLPRTWWTRNYWITDWSTFGLLAPPDGYVWVRVGPDAMLIDIDTGEVVRVVYGLFYF